MTQTCHYDPAAPGHIRTVNLDREWFAQHPGRQMRLRGSIADETGVVGFQHRVLVIRINDFAHYPVPRIGYDFEDIEAACWLVLEHQTATDPDPVLQQLRDAMRAKVAAAEWRIVRERRRIEAGRVLQ